MSYAVKAESVSKTYHISHKGRKVTSFREAVEQRLRRLQARLRLRALLPGEKEDLAGTEPYKALDDVSFEIAHGQNLAVIGQNGAGKSTLLKILSRITEPSTGRITIHGRISSLLEVGTGFHPELTGRENIFLNGTILGMPRGEIKKKFDEIVDFSEIEKFIDTPVKYYSSGMYVRLAFAVAAHLDPEILILDEVLAVGDLRFQQKCLQKMQYVQKEGRTIIFVSHNMQSVVQLCPQAILLEKGRIRCFGPTANAIKEYMGLPLLTETDNKLPDVMAVFQPDKQFGDACAELVEACVRDTAGNISATHAIDKPIYLEMRYRVFAPADRYLVPNFHIYNMENILIGVVNPANDIIESYGPGLYTATCQIPSHLLNDGVFRVMLALSSFQDYVIIHFSAPYALTFEVKDDLTDLSYRNGYMQSIPGLVRPQLQWTVERTT
ncbi:ABC transporter ATP-binding protein [Solidesulfovibrio sp.]|uniref:ABC transporter ATP-binding protein n=1 Tax=Solidesulfovibrio sp. TaxID=2910990 RepID=UPI0026137CE1|nr:ABC transporter ATP-binding protein [Solidesulfovibrio sp.]